jgi:hypothetical protein
MGIKKILATVRESVGKKKTGEEPGIDSQNSASHEKSVSLPGIESSSYVLGCSPTAGAQIAGYCDRGTAYPAVQPNQPIGRDSTAENIQNLYKGSLTERIECVKALGESGDPQAIPPLREVLNSLSEPYEEDIVVPGGWGNFYDTHPEQTIMHDPDKELRDAILDALKKLESSIR